MSKTLEGLRAELAQAVGMFLTGTATGGDADTIIDTAGLAHLTEENALENGLAYIRTDAGGAGAAPEGESRWVESYDEATQSIGVAASFSAAVGAGDVYEVYLAPLTLAQWDEAINAAIEAAWPAIWEPRTVHLTLTGQSYYALPDGSGDDPAVESVLAVYVQMRGILLGYPDEMIPRSEWHTQGQPADDLQLFLHRIPPTDSRRLRVLYKARYATLEAGESTDLDEEFLRAQTQARCYQMLAAEAGGQVYAGNFLKLMNYWQERADRRADAVRAELLGYVGGVQKKK